MPSFVEIGPVVLENLIMYKKKIYRKTTKIKTGDHECSFEQKKLKLYSNHLILTSRPFPLAKNRHVKWPISMIAWFK